METIDLPLTRCMRLTAGGLILGAALLLMTVPLSWPWRLGWALLVLATGAQLWRHYRRTRPAKLHRRPDGGLALTLADGARVTVRGLVVGVVNPWLVSARLLDSSGRHRDLFVPGPSLTGHAHWQLRRALLGFRPEDGQGPGDRGDASSPVRRGT